MERFTPATEVVARRKPPRWSVPTAVLSVRDRDVFGREDGYTRRFQMRILPKSKAVLRLGKDTF